MTATATKTCKFISKGRNLRLILLPQLREERPSGRTEITQKGYTVEFSRRPFDANDDPDSGTFEWPEDVVYVDPQSGETVKVVEDLRSHPFCNVQFWELGREPDRMLPEQSELLTAISKATVARDVDAIVDIHQSEHKSHRRDAVLTAAVSALEALESELTPSG